MHFGTIPTACGVFYDALRIFTVRSGAKQHTTLSSGKRKRQSLFLLDCACVGGCAAGHTVRSVHCGLSINTVGHDGHALFKTSADNRRRSARKSIRTNTQVFQTPPGFHKLWPYNAVLAGMTYCLKRAS